MQAHEYDEEVAYATLSSLRLIPDASRSIMFRRESQECCFKLLECCGTDPLYPCII